MFENNVTYDERSMEFNLGMIKENIRQKKRLVFDINQINVRPEEN